jgi:UPF0716 protein FxsA
MLFLLLFLFTVIPLVELALLMQLGNWLGFWPAVALVLGTGFAGAALAKWQGFLTAMRAREQLAQGVLPATALSDGLMILIAGVLLITPGVLTDIAGLSLLVPPVRHLVRRGVIHWFRTRVSVQQFEVRTRESTSPRDDNIIDVEVVPGTQRRAEESHL